MSDRDAALDVWEGLVSDLLSNEDARKSALETRALAVVTLNLSLTTVYIAATSHSSFLAGLSRGRTSSLIDTSFATVVASLVLAIASALPFAYGTFSLDGVKTLLKQANDGKTSASALRQEIARVRIQQLANFRRLNAVKVSLFYLSVMSAGAAVGAFVWAFKEAS